AGQGSPRHTQHGASGRTLASRWVAPILSVDRARASRLGAARSRDCSRQRYRRPCRQIFARTVRWTGGGVMRVLVGYAAVVRSSPGGVHVAGPVLILGLIGAGPGLVPCRWRTAGVQEVMATEPALTRPAVTRTSTGRIPVASLSTARVAALRSLIPRPA